MSKNFNPFPSVRRDRQRQLEREKQDSSAGATPIANTPVASPAHSPRQPVRPYLPARTSTEQTLRSSNVSSPFSPNTRTFGALYSPQNTNEPTTVRSSGLSSTDDEAFELYLSKQKELKAMRAKLEVSNRRLPSELAGSVAAQDTNDMESAYAHAPGGNILGLEETEEEIEGIDEEIELGHMQEIVEGLWIGDVTAARDERALREAGITAVLTLLRQKLPPPPPGILTLPIPIDDTPDADILCHLDGCVRWIADVLESEQAGNEDPDDDVHSVGKKGAVLVHCQAGMSRSATVVAAYLMKTLDISPEEAVEMIREKRPVVYPSETFRAQLDLWYKAKFKATVKDRDIRQWYMERTAAQIRNGGELEEEATQHMAKYPATPTASTPATPVGGHGKRKIRCKACRRNLATRDHMMDHILDQSPLPALRSRAPSVSLASLTVGEGDSDSSTSRRSSRPPSFSNSSRPAALSMSRLPTLDTNLEKAVPSPRRTESPSQEPQQPYVKKAGADAAIMKDETAVKRLPPPRRVLDPRALAASLPPQLAALRAGVPPSSGAGIPSPSNSSPAGINKNPPFIPFPVDAVSRRSSSPSSNASSSSSLIEPTDDSALSTSPDKANAGVKSVDAKTTARRTSNLAMTPSSPGSRSRRESASSFIGGTRRGSASSVASVSAANWPILVNPLCSGYFVEPLTWMEPMLASGALVGKITCPNEKCGAKIGSFDWAGVQCGCKEWVTPGFCIHRSKVDEVW